MTSVCVGTHHQLSEFCRQTRARAIVRAWVPYYRVRHVVLLLGSVAACSSTGYILKQQGPPSLSKNKTRSGTFLRPFSPASSSSRTRSHHLRPLPISFPSLQEGRALVVTTNFILWPTSGGQRYPVSAKDLAASAELEISKRDIKKGLSSSLQTLTIAVRTALLVLSQAWRTPRCSFHVMIELGDSHYNSLYNKQLNIYRYKFWFCVVVKFICLIECRHLVISQPKVAPDVFCDNPCLSAVDVSVSSILVSRLLRMESSSLYGTREVQTHLCR